MRLVARTSEKKFEVLQQLLQPNQKAFLQCVDDCEPVIRIRTQWIGAYDCLISRRETEITSADQLMEDEYKII